MNPSTAVVHVHNDPLISATAITKSGRVLCALSYFYFPLYGLTPRDVFWRFDPFAWISSVVYDIDAQIELGHSPDVVLLRLDDLAAYISARAELDSSVLQLFEDARRYYRFEYDVAQQRADYSLDELVRIVSIRSFDFRLMHRVLAQQSGIGYRETLFDWFQAFEMLMEIEDDAGSVKEDRERQTFNVVCLASRCDPHAGPEFVERLRNQVEADLRLREQRLGREERGLCARTLETYRELVQRPVLFAGPLNGGSSPAS